MSPTAAELNASCHCVGTQQAALAAGLPADGPASLAAVLDGRPHLFAPVPLFVDPADIATIRAVVAAIHAVSRLPGWTADLAEADHGPRGALMGYDFHISADGPQLIEVNTNAGGALLAARALDALEGCGLSPAGGATTAALEAALLETFRAEWASQRPGTPLRTVAIVDRAPTDQFLYPEFELFRALFARAGIVTVIGDPAELTWDGATLRHGELAIDLVYDRLTDFALAEPVSAALRSAYDAGAVVVTPNPRIHASLADKRRLALLGDAGALAALGGTPEQAALLERHVPRTVEISAANADELWMERKRWFFKPAAGFGSRAAYRGDKLTTGKWAEIRTGGVPYVAQRLVPPPERQVRDFGGLKYDLRAIAYQGDVQLVFARLYQGQTTNLRTPGGGFAATLSSNGVVACG